MLAERFKTQASEENLLVYTKEDNILNSNVVVRNNKDTLDAIMLIRNRIAKWQKINNTPLKYPEQLEDLEKKIAKYKESELETQQSIRKSFQKDNNRIDKIVDSIHSVRLPPLLTNAQSCRYCYSHESCALTALSIDNLTKRPDQFGLEKFDKMAQDTTIEVRSYFRRMVEAIN